MCTDYVTKAFFKSHGNLTEKTMWNISGFIYKVFLFFLSCGNIMWISCRKLKVKGLSNPPEKNTQNMSPLSMVSTTLQSVRLLLGKKKTQRNQAGNLISTKVLSALELLDSSASLNS